jgi:purine-binding chemotaxis protein CheW
MRPTQRNSFGSKLPQIMNATSQQVTASPVVRSMTANLLLPQTAQYLTFMLAGEMFAVGILGVNEILEYQSVTEVPMMPAYVRGVINRRGTAVPVIDLVVRFGKPSSAVGKRTCIVIVECGSADRRQVLGIVVDAVNAVLDISAAEIEPAPDFGAQIRRDFIQGMGRINEKFVVLLDLDHVLLHDELNAIPIGREATI